MTGDAIQATFALLLGLTGIGGVFGAVAKFLRNARGGLR